jgi:hypothetical protein
MPSRKKALIISYSNLNSDPRVLRQIEFIGRKYDIITAGVTASGHPNEQAFTPLLVNFNITFHFGFPKLLRKACSLLIAYPIYIISDMYERFYLLMFLKWIKNYDKYYWTFHRKKSLQKLNKQDFDLIVANDISALPLAAALKKQKGCLIYYDAHEYAPLEYDNDPKWLKIKSPYFTYLSKQYIPFADYCTTIGQMIADKFFELTGRHFDVVYNAPVYYELPIVLKEDGIIRCVHHGVASPIRKIENMVDAFIQLGPKYELHLLLMNNDNDYYQWLIKTAEKYPNIYMHKPVPTKEIPHFINQFDITLNFIPPVNFNYTCGLPNKFFESIQARIMLICGPLEEQRYLINQYGLGLVGNGFEYTDVIEVMRQVRKEDIRQYKENADKAAHLLSAESIMDKLLRNLEKIDNG